jgi:hypothetical protein
MARQHPARASKMQALVTMEAVSSPTDEVQAQRLRIKIPKCAWNAYSPPSQRTTRSTAKLKQTLTLKRKDGIPAVPLPRIHPKPCKTKLWVFHHGGTKRVTKGHTRHRIKCEEPCLRPACSNCCKWHPRLIGSRDGAVEPISPEIDPRILNGAWKSWERRRSVSVAETIDVTVPVRNAAPDAIETPILAPVNESFSHVDDDLHHPEISFPQQIPPFHDYDVFMPTSLVKWTISTASAKTKWRAELRKRWTVSLGFASCEGKQRFEEVVRRREKKDRKRRYDRDYRARLKGKEKGREEGSGESGSG